MDSGDWGKGARDHHHLQGHLATMHSLASLLKRQPRQERTINAVDTPEHGDFSLVDQIVRVCEEIDVQFVSDNINHGISYGEENSTAL